MEFSDGHHDGDMSEDDIEKNDGVNFSRESNALVCCLENKVSA